MSATTVLAALCLGAVVVSSVYTISPYQPAFRLPWKRRKIYDCQSQHTYIDADGEASHTATSVSQRLVTILIVASALSTLSISIAITVLYERNIAQLLVAIGWLLLTIDAFWICFESSQIRRFEVGVLLILCSLILSSEPLIKLYINSQAEEAEQDTTHQALQWVQIVLGLCLGLTSANLNRRPDVYFEEKLVDRQYTGSILQRYTFGWVWGLMVQARTERRIEYEDLPALDHKARSEGLETRMRSYGYGTKTTIPLWRLIIQDHFGLLCRQWIISILEGLLTLVPPYCLLRILALLEQRSSGELPSNFSLWFWVGCLSASKILLFGFQCWVMWVSFAEFATRVRSQLSAIIFSKALKMQLIHTENKIKDDQPSGAAAALADQSAIDEVDENAPLLADQTPGKKESADEADEDQTLNRGAARVIVSLLGVDVQRVSDFCGWNMDLLGGAVKIAAAAGFLVPLLGWWSTLAGFAVPLIFQPLNRYSSKRYYECQLEAMEARDNKAHVVGEALNGIRQIKFTATEEQWEKRIAVAREAELKAQWEVNLWGIILTFAWIAMPVFIGAVTLTVYALIEEKVTASVVFTALAILSSMQWTISALPMTITELLDAIVSIGRIEEHLKCPERKEVAGLGKNVEFQDATIAWPAKTRSATEFALTNLNLKFPSNELSVVHGKTGTGKTLLLNAIIGEADLVAGYIKTPFENEEELHNGRHIPPEEWIVPSAFAYVAQVPWIENASVRDAIAFGLPYVHERYIQVIHACALTEDIKLLPDGHDTEIGATGINLSGGQKWRLTLARALYSRAGVLVFDDIFSAVDSHVGRHMLQEAILGPLGADRTKILVTHHIDLVQEHAAYLVRLNGKTAVSVTEKVPGQQMLSTRPTTPESSTKDNPISDQANGTADVAKAAPQKFVQDETREFGRVKWSVYKTYMSTSGGAIPWLTIVVMYALVAILNLLRAYWLTVWTDAYEDKEDAMQVTKAASRTPSTQPNVIFYLGIYVALSVISMSFVAAKLVCVLVAALRAARRLFESVTYTVIRAPLRWLDTEPSGRILNRFVGDFALIDNRLGGDMAWCIDGVFTLSTIIAAALLVSVWMFVPIVVLLVACIYVVHLYMDCARDIKRLESIAKSPIFELVESTLLGLATIRCYGKTEDFLRRMYRETDKYAQATWHVHLSAQWMKFRQGALGVLFTLCAAIGVICLPSIDAALAGFALSFALDFSSEAEHMINRYTSTELDMNATERVTEYMNMKTESQEGEDAPSWPEKGAIEVRDLDVGYAEDLPSVLKGISFSIPSCARIGIVGRTGSGKSSLTLALFRLLEAREGSINIDGVDISTLKLHHLRSRLAIIPQDPVLFSGSLRDNLDPFGQYSDVTLIEALDRLGLRKAQRAMSNSEVHRSRVFSRLSSPITRGGLNLSQGEKQLICLARAIISQPKILVLDEATSAVDMETDALIQRSIREEFKNSTLLVVAHRLSTVADFDKILVLSDGRVAEYDEPRTLAQQKGAFWRMLNDSGEKEKLQRLME